jgi:hypothetical protein
MMDGADELIARIVSLSRIPSEKRRQAVVRELSAHIEDFMLAARESEHADDRARTSALASFGDPEQIAREFACVYRRDWTVLRVWAFLLSIVTIASLVSATTLAAQAGIAIGFGVPLAKILASRHTVIQILDIVSTVAAYLGLISLEKLFRRHRLQNAIALLAPTVAVLTALSAAAGAPVRFLVFGFVNAVFFRATQVLIKNRGARFAFTVACFALAGLVSVQLQTGTFTRAIAVNCASWLVMGTGYQLMAKVAARVEAALFGGLQWI